METALQEEKTRAFTNESKKDQLALVAGGASFLGAALCKALLAQGYSVLCLDNLSHSSRENIEEMLQNSKFSFLQEDFSSPTFKPEASLVPSLVFHLASFEGHSADQKPSLDTLLVNSVGTKNLLDIAAGKKAKFIFLSSPDVFQAALPQSSIGSFFAKDVRTETLAFAEGKRFGETLIAEYYKKFDLDTSIVRIKDPYGPAMGLQEKGTINQLLFQALERGKIEILGDGLQTANPTFVSDIVEGLLKTAFANTKGEILQLINPDRYTEKAIAEQLKLILGNVEVVEKKKARIVDLGQPLILEETQEKLDWAPKTSLEEGLNQTVAYFLSQKTKEKKVEEVKAPVAEKPMAKATSRRGWIVGGLLTLAFATIIWVFLFPAATVLLNFGSGNNNLAEAIENLNQPGQAGKVTISAKSAEGNFTASQTAVKSVSWTGYLPFLTKAVESSESYLFLAESLGKATKYTGQALEKIEHAAQPGTSQQQAREDLAEAQKDFDQAEVMLEVYATVKVKENDLPLGLKKDLQKLKQEKETLEKILQERQEELQSLI